MMKTYLIIAAVILSVSCSTNNPESIRKNIISKKEQIARINQSIKKLEEKLYEDSTGMNPQFLIPVKIKEVIMNYSGKPPPKPTMHILHWKKVLMEMNFMS